ncbi:hypothetical protein [Streptomyces sp. NRRL F-5135]|uniref:hypothetical protein n=1 Tax=Streptomyces sp. NRRL F-5135 TaxID=1463858 RepID=UPI00068F747C|nr:hypothetical protein [Streptomyces sp. NRRL F-5135]
MRALTLKYPWSAAVAYGPKRIDNRSTPIPEKHLGTTVFIHAGAGEDENVLPADMVRAWPRHSRAVVAVATLASCHQAAKPVCCAPWGFPNAWHWVLENVRPVPHPPRPVRGQLGLWTVPAEVVAAVQGQVDIPLSVGS